MHTGEKTVLDKANTEAVSAAKIMIPPYEREIYVIAMIKKKVCVCVCVERERTQVRDRKRASE
jgi:hypothetical protein